MAVHTLLANQVRPVKQKEIAHVREIAAQVRIVKSRSIKNPRHTWLLEAAMEKWETGNHKIKTDLG